MYGENKQGQDNVYSDTRTGFSTEVVHKQDCINQQPDNEGHERDKPDIEHLIHMG